MRIIGILLVVLFVGTGMGMLSACTRNAHADVERNTVSRGNEYVHGAHCLDERTL